MREGEFSLRLRAERLAAGLTQKSLAERDAIDLELDGMVVREPSPATLPAPT